MKNKKYPEWYIKRDNVFEESRPNVFVGRKKLLEHYWRELLYANNAFIENMALISQRKMGKTAMLKRFCNVLYSDQREVIPLFYSFPQEEERKKNHVDDTAKDMMFTFSKQFAAFVFQRSDFFALEDEQELIEEIRAIDHPSANMLVKKLTTYESRISKERGHYKIQRIFDIIVSLVKRSGLRCMIVIDEVQEMDLCIYDDKDNLLHCTSALTRIYQMLSSVWLVVTGSKVSCISNKIIVDAMRNRISLKSFYPLDEEETTDFVRKLIDNLGQKGYSGIEKDIFDLTGGNPYYIQQLFCYSDFYEKTKGKNKNFDSRKNLLDVFNFEVRNKKGSIYDYWNIHFEQNIDNLNCDGDKPGITAKILYFIAEKSRELEDKEPYVTKVGNTTISNREVEIDFEEIVEKLAIDMDLVIEKIQQLENADFISADIQGTRCGMITDRILPIFLLDKYHKKIFPEATKEEAEEKITEIMDRVGKLEQHQKETEQRQKETEKEQQKREQERKEVGEKIGKEILKLRGDVNILKGKRGEEIVCEAIKYGVGIFEAYRGQQCIQELVPDKKRNKHDIDVFVRGHEANGTKGLLPLAIEVKNERSKVYIGQANYFIECVKILKKKYNIRNLKAYFVCLEGASRNALTVLEENGIELINFREICPSYQVQIETVKP